MCISGTNPDSIISADRNLLITYCQACIEVYAIPSMQLLKTHLFENRVQLHVEENKKGNFEFSAAGTKLKYIRKTNEFVAESVGVLVYTARGPNESNYLSIGQFNERGHRESLADDIGDVLEDYVTYGKKTLYYIKVESTNQDMIATCRIHRLTFNIKMNLFETAVSNFTFEAPGKFVKMILDRDTSRLLIGAGDKLLIVGLHNLKLKCTIRKCKQFTKNYAIAGTSSIFVIELKNKFNQFVLTTCSNYAQAVIDKSIVIVYYPMMDNARIFDIKDPTHIISGDLPQNEHTHISACAALDSFNKILLVGDGFISLTNVRWV